MNDLALKLWFALVWTINGLLVIVYYSTDHILVITLVVTATLFAAYTPKEQRAWAAGSSALAILTSFVAPMPVPLFLLVISMAGWIAQWLEQYNRPAQRWNTIRWQALYALSGLGFATYRYLGLGDTVAVDPMMSQGAVYLDAIIGIAMYVIPLGFLAMLAQSIFALPPAPGTPENLITKIRTRGKN